MDSKSSTAIDYVTAVLQQRKLFHNFSGGRCLRGEKASRPSTKRKVAKKEMKFLVAIKGSIRHHRRRQHRRGRHDRR